jgi:hypothetical protein
MLRLFARRAWVPTPSAVFRTAARVAVPNVKPMQSCLTLSGGMLHGTRRLLAPAKSTKAAKPVARKGTKQRTSRASPKPKRSVTKSRITKRTGTSKKPTTKPKATTKRSTPRQSRPKLDESPQPQCPEFTSAAVPPLPM